MLACYYKNIDHADGGGGAGAGGVVHNKMGGGAGVVVDNKIKMPSLEDVRKFVTNHRVAQFGGSLCEDLKLSFSSLYEVPEWCPAVALQHHHEINGNIEDVHVEQIQIHGLQKEKEKNDVGVELEASSKKRTQLFSDFFSSQASI